MLSYETNFKTNIIRHAYARDKYKVHYLNYKSGQAVASHIFDAFIFDLNVLEISHRTKTVPILFKLLIVVLYSKHSVQLLRNSKTITFYAT